MILGCNSKCCIQVTLKFYYLLKDPILNVKNNKSQGSIFDHLRVKSALLHERAKVGDAQMSLEMLICRRCE